MSSGQHGTSDEVGRRVESAVRAVLPRQAKVKTFSTDPTIELAVNDVVLRADFIGEGWLAQLKPLLAAPDWRPDIVVARRMSPGAREALAVKGIGWVDETGAAEIVIESLVVSRTGRSGSAVERPPRWTRSVLAVAEALLCGTQPTVAATEEATRLSTGSCTAALRALTDLGLLEAQSRRGRRSARTVPDPPRLLEAYASAAEATPSRIPTLQVGVTWQDVVVGLGEAGKRWDKAHIAWATTGPAASMVVAPFLTSVRTADVFIGAHTVAELETTAAEGGLRPMQGGRLALQPFPTTTTRQLADEIGGLRVAPWPRIYADLRSTGVRGEEAAEHLRELHHDH